jgi:lysozyme
MDGKSIVRKFEGCKLTAYLCPAGIPTIGYGHTHNVKLGDTCTQQQADEWLEDDFFYATSDVKAVVKVPLTDNQLDALASFVFNLGVRKLIRSTLLKKLNAKDYTGAANEFDKWVFAAGKKLNGLIARRAAEKALFLS